MYFEFVPIRHENWKLDRLRDYTLKYRMNDTGAASYGIVFQECGRSRRSDAGHDDVEELSVGDIMIENGLELAGITDG